MPKSHIGDKPKISYLGDNCLQSLHLGSYIVRYTCTVGNLVLQGNISGAITRDFGLYIRHFIPK